MSRFRSGTKDDGDGPRRVWRVSAFAMSGGRGGPPIPTNPDGSPTRPEKSFGGGSWSSHGDYMRDKEDKMQQQQVAETAIVSDALRNIVLHIDGNSDARSADLSQLVVAHSGRYVQYPHWSEVTHLLANMLPAAKIKFFSGHMAECRRRGHPFFVVTEAWLVQSAAAKRRLPEADFALPTLLDPEQGSLRGFVKQAAAAAAQPPAAAAASSPPPPPAPEPPLPPPAPQPSDRSMMPPPPPKRPRQAEPPAPAASSSAAASSAASSSTSSGWFVSVRVAAASGESPTQGSSAAACDAMQRRLLSAMRSQLGGGEAAEVEAYPLLPDQAVTLSPLQTIDETSLKALAKDLLKATEDDDAVALRAVGVGVARELGLAMTAALAAMRSSPTGGVRWLLSDGDASSLLGSRPISALMPLLHVSEYSTLSSEGVTTCSELVQFGEAALRMRFGPQRATWLLEAAQTALVPNNLLATIEQAGGLPPPPPPPPPPPAAAPPPPPPHPTAFDDSDWEISCSQVDVSVISAIGGEEGERIRHQFETAQKQRAASSNGGGGSSSSTSAAPAAAVVEEGPPAESGPHWDCSVCTYRHSGEEAEYLVCKQCFTQRPAGTIQPASGSQNGRAASSRPAPPPAQQQQQRSPTRRTEVALLAGKTSGRGGARGRGATPVVVVVQVEAARTFGRRGALRAMVKVQVGVEVVVVERRQRRRRMEAVISRSLLRRRGGAHWTLGHAMTALLKWSTSMRTTTRCRRLLLLLLCALAGAALFSSRGRPCVPILKHGWSKRSGRTRSYSSSMRQDCTIDCGLMSSVACVSCSRRCVRIVWRAACRCFKRLLMRWRAWCERGIPRSLRRWMG